MRGVGDLGFRYRVLENGDVQILRDDEPIARLREKAAAKLLHRAESADDAEIQQILASVTGNCRPPNARPRPDLSGNGNGTQ